MKKFVFIFVVSIVYAACTGKSSLTNEAATIVSNSDSSVTLPYTADYSSKFSLGSDSSSLAVLNNYKAWETGDMDALKNTFGDSVTLVFSDGFKFIGTRDSLMYYASKYRDSLSKVEMKMGAWIPLHSDDKNEDWVSVWYTEIDTHKNDKVDSAF